MKQKLFLITLALAVIMNAAFPISPAFSADVIKLKFSNFFPASGAPFKNL